MSSLFRLTKTVISNPLLARGLLNRVLNHAPAAPRTQRWLAVSSIRAQGTAADFRPDETSHTEVDSRRKVNSIVSRIDANFSRFEDRCQRAERVNERDFIRTFDSMTRALEELEAANQLTEDIKLNFALQAAILMRCCGKLMSETPEKTRELLAGNLWHFLKEKKIPLDISHYNSLLRVLNENQTTYDPKKLHEEINNSNLVPDRVTYQRLIHQYCLQGDINGATELLEKMKDLSMELNELTFASLIVGYNKQEQPPSMKEMFELMKSNNVEPGGRSYAAAITSLAELLPKKPAITQELETLLKSLEKEDIQFTIYEQIDIMNSLSAHRDNEVVSKILRYVSQSQPSTMNSRFKLMSALIKNGQFEETANLYWSQKPSQRALESGNIGIYYIKLLASHKNVPVDHCIKECSKLREMGHNLKPFHLLYYSAAESGHLDLVRASLNEISKHEPVKVPYLWPLLAQAENEEEIEAVLKNDFDPTMDSNDLLDTFAQWVWPKFPNVSRLFELNTDLKYDNNLLIASYLNYAVQEDKIMEAIKFISEVPQGNSASPAESKSGDDDDTIGLPRIDRTYQREALVARLLRQIAEETKDPDLVKRAFELCMSPGLNITSRTVSPLVKTYLLDCKFDKALEEFLRLANEYKVTPCKTDLIIHCLEKKDSANLQKIMDVSSELYGESNALFDLAVACIKIGKLKQAQKIFASPTFRVNPMRIHRTSRSIANMENIKVLENFVHLSRDMYDVNQEYLYQVLIETYDRTSNGKAALELWSRMQEEEFQPSKRSLLALARVLEKNNIEVPFQKPKGLDESTRRRVSFRDEDKDGERRRY